MRSSKIVERIIEDIEQERLLEEIEVREGAFYSAYKGGSGGFSLRAAGVYPSKGVPPYDPNGELEAAECDKAAVQVLMQLLG